MTSSAVYLSLFIFCCAFTSVAAQNECNAMADVILVTDASSSITWDEADNWNDVKNFLIALTDAFTISQDDTRVALIKFYDSANTEFFLDRYDSKSDVQNRIRRMVHNGGETNLAYALRLVRSEVLYEDGVRLHPGNRPEAPDIVIVVTDGQPNIDVQGVRPAADALHELGAIVITVGITDDVDEEELLIVADGRQDRVFQVYDFNNLDSITGRVIAEACEDLPTPDPDRTTSPTPRSTTRSTITTERTTSATTPRSTARPAPVEGCIGRDADVVFLLDSSGSINRDEFQLLLDFVSDVVDELDIEGGKIRVGCATFGSSYREEFPLDRYQNRPQVSNAVQSIEHSRGRTNTAQALRRIREDMFTRSNGARSDAAKVLFVITDGQSNDEEETARETLATKAAGIDIISIGIGDWLDVHELLVIASYPVSDNRLLVDDFDELDDIVDDVKDIVCGNHIRCDRRPCRNGDCVNGVRSHMCTCEDEWGGETCNDRCRNAADVVFAVDASGSVGEDNFRKILDFVTATVQRLDIDNGRSGSSGTRVGMVLFGNDAAVQFNLNDYTTRRDILNSINVRYTAGTTNTAQAIRTMREDMFTREEGDRSGVKNFAIVITDGKSEDRPETWNQAMLARQAGIHIMSVGIGGGVDDKELRGMASAPISENVMRVDEYDDLGSIVDKMTNGLCNNENECSRNPCRNGDCVDGIFGYSCANCHDLATGANCERSCSGDIDLVIALDRSGSIRSERFPLVIDFVTGVLEDLDIHPERTRVGMASFSDNAVVDFNLNEYDTKENVIQAARKIEYTSGKTNIPAALQIVRERMFTSSAGDRSNMPNFLLIFTDGNSNIDEELTVPRAVELRNENIHIIVGSVGLDINRLELEGIASEPFQENQFSVESIQDLPQIHDQIVNALCDDEDMCASGPCRNRGSCIRAHKRYTCRCATGFTGYNCDRRCNRQLDVAFVLDISGSVEDEYRMVRGLAREIVYGLDDDQARFSAVAYSTEIVSSFLLNTYQERDDVINALNFHRKKGGRTNTQQALSYVRNTVYRSDNGDRSRVRDVVIVITDGYSNVDTDNTIREAQRLKDDGAEIFTIGIGDSPNIRELNEIASTPQTDYTFYTETVEDVEETASDILDNLCEL